MSETDEINSLKEENDDGTIGQEAARLSAEDLKGCWISNQVPCGVSISRISPRGDDEYVAYGIYFLLFVIPIPFIDTATREHAGGGRNTFASGQNSDHKTKFLNDKTIDPGPFCCKGGYRY